MAAIELRGLPKIEENTGVAADAAIVMTQHLEGIRDTIGDMSVRLNIKLGTIATMLSDFFDTSKAPATIDAYGGNDKLLFGINVKLGSIAMMLGEFFEDVRSRWMRESLTNNNNEQVKPPKDNSNPKKPPNVKPKDSDWTQLLSNILTGLGVAFLAAKINFGEAFEESGIIAVVAKAFTKALIIGSGLSALVAKLTSGNALGGLLKSFGTFVEGIHSFGMRFGGPLYRSAVGLAKWGGKIVPIVAFVTTVIDFIRGFNKADNVFDGVKLGIAEVAAGWIGWPLEILKDIVSWAAGKLGFENFAGWLDSFNLVEMVKSAVVGVFDFFKALVHLDTSQLPTVEEFKAMLISGLGAAIDMGIALFKSVFNISPQEVLFNITEFLKGVIDSGVSLFKSVMNFDYAGLLEETKTKLTDAFWSALNDVKTFFTDMFKSLSDMLPSKDDLVKKLRSYLPDFITGEGEYSIDNQIKGLEAKIAEQNDSIKRSMEGEDVFNGPESWGQNRALAQVQEATRQLEELRREQREAAKATGGNTNVSIVQGGNVNTNASNMNVNQWSSSPANERPDFMR